MLPISILCSVGSGWIPAVESIAGDFRISSLLRPKNFGRHRLVLELEQARDIALRVSLESETERRVRLRFQVEDSGIGISPEAQKKLFQAFRTCL